MIFEEQISRKPVKYTFCQPLIDAMTENPWTVNKFSFSSDVLDFKTKLTEEERTIVTKTLSCIAQIEVAVKTFWGNLGKSLPRPELVDLGYVMAYVEVIHNQAYEKLLDVLQMNDIFEENLKLAVLQNRVNYLRKYNKKIYADNKQQYLYSIILFTLFVENVSLFSQFYTVLWFNRTKGYLKDTAQQVQFTTKEETLHARAGTEIIKVIKSEYPELIDQEFIDRIIQEAKEAFEAESKLVDWMLGDFNESNANNETLNAETVKEFIKDRMNASLKDIGFEPVFEVDKEILKGSAWMSTEIWAPASTDFFHKAPIEYSKNQQSFDVDDLI